MYKGMNDYQKNFLKDEEIDTLKKYVKKMETLVAAAEANKDQNKTEDTDKDKDTDKGGSDDK